MRYDEETGRVKARTKRSVEEMLMQMTGQRETRGYPQSRGNLALTGESLGVLQTPKAKPCSPRLMVVPAITDEEVETEALAPTIGMLNGIRLSLTLWSVIGVIILLINELLDF